MICESHKLSISLKSWVAEKAGEVSNTEKKGWDSYWIILQLITLFGNKIIT